MVGTSCDTAQNNTKFLLLIEAKWRIYVVLNKGIIGPHNGLLLVWYQAIVGANSGVFLIETVSPEGTLCDTVQLPSSAGDMELN